jgi:hypothetical protein
MQGPAPTPLPPGFDLNLLVEKLVPLVAVLAAILVGGLALRWFFRSPIGEAIAEGIRLRRRRRYGADLGETGDQRVADLERELQAVQGQLTELGERLDFAERLLAQSKEPERLRPPRG